VEQNELLRYTIRALHDLGIPYLIGGSLASSAYGEPRLTNDIDLVADLRLQQQFARRRTLRMPDGEEADFASPEDVILNKLIYWKMGQSERQLNDILGMLRVQGGRLDRAYIRNWAARPNLTEAWEAVLGKATKTD
jgi:hypothetical protein